jgi:hypothetical protein
MPSINLPKKSTTSMGSIYAPLGLKDMPFPSNGFVNPHSPDPKINGAIYAVSTAKETIAKFESLLIRPDDFPNRAQLAYLWAKGDSETGRGVGKTALLQYFRQRINKDWGNTEFNGKFLAAVIYVGFKSQVDRRYMEQLALSGLVDVCKNGVLEASRAVLRLNAMPEDKAELVLSDDSEGEAGADNLLKDQILTKHGVDPVKLDDSVAKTLIAGSVEAVVARQLARGTFEDYLRSMRKDGQLEPLYVPRDTKILEYSRTLLFNDVVNYLRAAGYGGGYLFIDDIENLVDQMARKQRIEFAKEFGLCTVRPGYANTAYKFFSCVLTTHQQASSYLAVAWGEAGLAAVGRLDPGSQNSVELPFPSKDQAKDIIVAHLDYYRLNEKEKGSIKPFTPDGIDELLGAPAAVHPRTTLSKAANVVQYAVDKKLTSINREAVKAATASVPNQVAAPDFSDGIEGAS